MVSKPHIGELLVGAGLITQAQLDEVLESSREETAIGRLLVRRGLVGEQELIQTISRQLMIPWVSLSHIEIPRQLLDRVPASVAERHELLPIFLRAGRSHEHEDTLYVVTSDPTDEEALSDVSRHVGLPVRAMIASKTDIQTALRAYYGSGSSSPKPSAVQTYPGEAPVISRSDPPPKRPPAPVAPVPSAPPVPSALPLPSALPVPLAPPSPSLPAKSPVAPPAKAPAPSSSPPASKPGRSVPPPPSSTRSVEGKKRPTMALTLLDGTTIKLPGHDAGSETPQLPSIQELVAALRARSQGEAPATGPEPRWEPIVAALLSLLLRKGFISDRELLEELTKI